MHIGLAKKPALAQTSWGVGILAGAGRGFGSGGGGGGGGGASTATTGAGAGSGATLFAEALLRTTGLGAGVGWDAEAATKGGSTRPGSATATSLAAEALATGADASTSVKAAGGSAISVMMSSATGALRAYSPQPALATAMKATAATAPQRKLLWRRGTAVRVR